MAGDNIQLAQNTDAELAAPADLAVPAADGTIPVDPAIDPNAAPLDEMRRLLNPGGVPDFEACATVGTGVFETLKAVAKGVLTDLKKMGS